MARVTHVRSMDVVARRIGENLELIELISVSDACAPLDFQLDGDLKLQGRRSSRRSLGCPQAIISSVALRHPQSPYGGYIDAENAGRRSPLCMSRTTAR